MQKGSRKGPEKCSVPDLPAMGPHRMRKHIRRTLQDTTWPSFIFNSPKSIVREFLAGLFGGDGHAPYSSKTSVISVKFSQSVIEEKKENFALKMNKLCDLLNMFDVKAEIERVRDYKTKDKKF